MSAVSLRNAQTAVSSSGSLTITKPTGLVVGDLMVLQVQSAGTAKPVLATPTGWTILAAEFGDLFTLWATFYKIADATDVAASSFAFTVTTTGSLSGSAGAISAWINQGAVPFDAGATASASGTTALPTISSRTIAQSNAMFCVLAFNKAIGGSISTTSGYSIGTDNPPAWSEAYDAGNNTGSEARSIALGYAARGPITSTGTISATASSATTSAGLLFVSIIPSPIPVASSTSAAIVPFSVRVILEVIAAAASAAIAPATNIIPVLWRNAAKHAASWLNEPKS